MTDYGQMAEVTPEEKAEILRKVAVGIHNVVDSDTQFRRDQSRKRELLEIKQEEERNMRLSELQIAREKQIDLNNRDAIIKKNHWTKWGNFPGPLQKFYDIKPCIFCQQDTAHISEYSANIRPEDSLTLGYSLEQINEYKNHPNLHYCNPENIDVASTLHFLIKRVHELEVEDRHVLQKAKEYAMMSGMRPGR